MVLDYPMRSTGPPSVSPQTHLRQRKQLPPLTSPSTELSMEKANDPLADESNNANANNTRTTKPDVALLLRLHAQFARAFKRNDAAQLLPYLHKDVTLVTLDGQAIRGASAVLGCLVGPRMSKLSGALHVKQARATPCGDAQSAFVYEHGLVFKEPLYSEVMDWEADSFGGHVVTRITHTRLSSLVGETNPVADVVKVVAALPHRLSLNDEDHHHHNNDNATLSPPGSRRSSLVDEGNAVVSPMRSSTDDLNIGAVVTRVAVANKLSPIRKRKLVNAFLTVENCDGNVLWKSSVAKKQLLPVWSDIELELPPPLEADVVVTLWDYGLFRSLRVATARSSAAQLLEHERGGLAKLELKPMGLSSASVELTFSITRLNDDHRAWRPRSASFVSTVAAVDAAKGDCDDHEEEDASTALVWKTGRAMDMLTLDSAWLLATSAVGVLLVCAALLWLHTNGQLMAK